MSHFSALEFISPQSTGGTVSLQSKPNGGVFYWGFPPVPPVCVSLLQKVWYASRELQPMVVPIDNVGSWGSSGCRTASSIPEYVMVDWPGMREESADKRMRM